MIAERLLARFIGAFVLLNLLPAYVVANLFKVLRVAGAATVHLCIRGAHDTSFPSSRLALPPLAADDAGLVDAALLLGHWSSSNKSKSSPKKTSRPPGTIGHRPIDLVAAGKGERL
jgi:hypothetical protein